MTNARMSIAGVKLLPEDMLNRVSGVCDDALSELKAIWKEAGYEDAECQGLLGDFFKKIEGICTEEIKSERQILDHAKETVTKKVGQLKELYAQLGRVCPYDGDGQSLGDNVTDQLSKVESMISEISVDVNVREELMTVEIDAIDELVNALGAAAPGEELFAGHEDSPKLSDARLNILRECRATFETIRDERATEMEGMLKTCASYCLDMKVSEEGWDTVPDSEEYTTIDKGINEWVAEDVNSLDVHETTLEKLRARQHALGEEKERRREMLASTGGEIAHLWTLLRIPDEERDAFQSSFQMNLSMETLTRGRDELDRLKALRLASLGDVVQNIRTDIATLWIDAGIEDEHLQRSEFPAAFETIDDVSEESLLEHETYYDTLKARVEVLKPLLHKVSRRETIVQERLQLEHLQMNPERLTARGPKAREDRKKEEQMQSNVKKLDKLSKELRRAIVEWEDGNGEHFIFAGERYLDRMTQQDADYIDQRDTLRNARKNSKKSGKEGLSSTAPAPLPGKTRRSTVTNTRPSKVARVEKDKTSSAAVAAMVETSDAENVSLTGNTLNPRASMCSVETDCTSMTEVKVRASTATAVREEEPETVETF